MDKGREGYTATAPQGIPTRSCWQQDKMTHRRTTLYVHAMELFRLGDACMEAYERGMKILKDGIASLTEFEE